MFADSLPDAWGRRVQDLWFQKIGIESPHPFDRLAYIGDHGIGALSYKPALRFSVPGKTITDLAQLRRAALGVLRGDVSSVTAELGRIGGSAGGMYPKYLVNIDPDSGACSCGAAAPQGQIPAIVKVPVRRGDQTPRVEYAYSRMAAVAGIAVPPSHLLHRGSQSYYVVRRFDIPGRTGRLHVHSLAGMLGINYTERLIDYRQAFRLTNGLTRDSRQIEQLYRRMAFNVLAVNCDDHAKNMSFVMDGRGAWTLSPAYDLTHVSGTHAMSVNGAVSAHSRRDFESLAREFGVVGWEGILREVADALDRWPSVAAQAKVPADLAAAIAADMAGVRSALIR